MAVTVAAGESTTPIRLTPDKRRAFAGTLSGTSTLTPELSFDGKATWVGIASSVDLAALAFTSTFPAMSIQAPDEQEVWFRVTNSSGSDAWTVHGLPAPPA